MRQRRLTVLMVSLALLGTATLSLPATSAAVLPVAGAAAGGGAVVEGGAVVLLAATGCYTIVYDQCGRRIDAGWSSAVTNGRIALANATAAGGAALGQLRSELDLTVSKILIWGPDEEWWEPYWNPPIWHETDSSRPIKMEHPVNGDGDDTVADGDPSQPTLSPAVDVPDLALGGE